MKKQILKITTVLFMAMAVVACKKAKNETEAKEAEEVKEVADAAANYKVDTENSTITWKGFKPTGTHNGTVKLSEGAIAVESGNVTGGNFMIDMNSISVLDIESPEDNGKLTSHLKSGDFFDTANHGFGAFSITGVEAKDGKTMVSGNLTLKGIKKNIEFPVMVSMNGDELNLTSAPFSIDRTEWDIKYKSTKFFDDLKDKFINDNMEIAINVKAKK